MQAGLATGRTPEAGDNPGAAASQGAGMAFGGIQPAFCPDALTKRLNARLGAEDDR